ncbi:uncharacterized protein LOC114965829 isoform X2 [Acropora millepora]|uniref:uncharacterized protein LOC114965829 isoform X2 n=2 Tax=Acropora millepora TaxID=45264 RepID=UPI001CF4F051|nr:uncharacterized protein LOC114965829 isoform X2 [Acropora millepora]
MFSTNYGPRGYYVERKQILERMKMKISGFSLIFILLVLTVVSSSVEPIKREETRDMKVYTRAYGSPPSLAAIGAKLDQLLSIVRDLKRLMTKLSKVAGGFGGFGRRR